MYCFGSLAETGCDLLGASAIRFCDVKVPNDRRRVLKVSRLYVDEPSGRRVGLLHQPYMGRLGSCSPQIAPELTHRCPLARFSGVTFLLLAKDGDTSSTLIAEQALLASSPPPILHCSARSLEKRSPTLSSVVRVKFFERRARCLSRVQ